LGKSFVSKRIKQFLRNYKPKNSWLIHPNPIDSPDPFQCLTKIFNSHSIPFLEEIITYQFPQNTDWIESWLSKKKEIVSLQDNFYKQSAWEEIHIFNRIVQVINTKEVDLHIANSLSIRYNNWTKNQLSDSEVFSNRGTSGIDGCLSTAIGASQRTPKLCVSIIGDVAFHYDKNALWNNYLQNNVRIIIFNNHGGGIFRNLAGAGSLPELEEFMETRQNFKAENTANDAQINYLKADNWIELESVLPIFFDNQQKASILEIFTDSITNAEALKLYMNLFRS
jgi:2-succinyl-5-enolpyruvyl-6-hydroxy-3-cyclohexene-1-carboxylate synthase